MLNKSFPRLWSLDSGVVMAVSDLHGDWEAYRLYRDCFLNLRAQGLADYLIFTGDLIHSELPEEQDGSLAIVTDIIGLRSALGDACIYLCGNHELPHIYGIGLARGKVEYTPRFEKAMSDSGQRPGITQLFSSLPFFIRTAAGVSLSHAGAGHELATPDHALAVFNYDHQAQLEEVDRQLEEEDIAGLQYAYARMSGAQSYDDLVRYYLAVHDKHDSRFNDLLRGSFVTTNPDYGPVYSTLFTRCEKLYGVERYALLLEKLLRYLSLNYSPQNVLVAGHIRVKGGYEIVADSHLRIASSAHATPREAGVYLLFDAARPVQSPVELLSGLRSVFR